MGDRPGLITYICFIENEFEVFVVKDTTAASRQPELGDGYQAALIDYGYIANAVLPTDQILKAMA